MARVFIATWERVAQLVEHRTFNPVVAGSIPAPFTILFKSASTGRLFDKTILDGILH